MKKHLPLYLLWIFTTLFSLQVSCSDLGVEQGGPAPIDDVVSLGVHPLKVGYYWHYKTVTLKEDSTEGNEFEQVKFEITRHSYNPQTPDEPMFHKVFVNPSTNTRSEYEWLYRNYVDGLYLMGGRMSTDSIDTNILLLKHPVSKGESWISPHLVYHLIDREYQIPDSTVYTCVDTNAVFETPVGTFSCYVFYHRESLDDDVSAKADVFEYYSSEVGLVGVVTMSYFKDTQQRIPKSKRILISTNVLN
ncbi:MAG: hypothetical protein WEB37_10165 [Bacteroidota bacterium]